jgi:hypothetical protein
VEVLANTPHALLMFCIFLFLMTGAFFLRMAVLRQGMWEYAFLLSWPLHRSLTGEGAITDKESHARKIPFFLGLKGIWQRTQHWDHLEDMHQWGMAVLLLAGAGLFEVYVIAQGASSGFYMKPFSNFILFVVTPVFMTLCFNYRIFAFGRSALLWPVRREDLIRQWGFRVAMYLGVTWFLTVILFAVIPGALLGMPFMIELRFWVYLALTGGFAYFVLVWLALLVAMKQNWRVGVHMAALCFIVQGEFFVVPHLGPTLLFVNLTLVLTGSILFTRDAYRKWLQVEF